jgi:hypothetical protein
VDIFDREAVFIDEVLAQVTSDFSELKIVFEHITTNILSLNTAHVLNTTFCDKFVSDLWQVCGFLWVPRFPPQIKLTATI